MNPLLPFPGFIPDVEAHTMPDGRLYLYGSLDESGSPEYCSRSLKVYSTADPLMREVTDHGIVITNTAAAGGIPGHVGVPFYAPDALYVGGKYLLYYCGADGMEGTAVSDSPAGPFTDPQPLEVADGDGIDPCIFVDDDGSVYYFWGGGTLRGAQLTPDGRHLIPETVHRGILTEWEHGFHEGSSIRKRNGIYYLVYTDISRGRATCISYATSRSVFGPYTKGGVIIDNTFCDNSTWNNHGSIAPYGGKWYVFYHRSSQDSNTSRRVCVEPITFGADGSIAEVVMTSGGAEGELSAFRTLPAACACRIRGDMIVHPDPTNTKEILSRHNSGPYEGSWAEYRYLDFGFGAKSFTLKAAGHCHISVRISGMGEVASLTLDSDELREIIVPLTRTPTGTHVLWLVLGGMQAELDSFRFDA